MRNVRNILVMRRSTCEIHTGYPARQDRHGNCHRTLQQYLAPLSLLQVQTKQVLFLLSLLSLWTETRERRDLDHFVVTCDIVITAEEEEEAAE